MPQPHPDNPWAGKSVFDQRSSCSFFYRRAIAFADRDQLRELALTLLDELEDHRIVFLDYGISPPLRHDPEETCALILRQRRAGQEATAP